MPSIMKTDRCALREEGGRQLETHSNVRVVLLSSIERSVINRRLSRGRRYFRGKTLGGISLTLRGLVPFYF